MADNVRHDQKTALVSLDLHFDSRDVLIRTDFRDPELSGQGDVASLRVAQYPNDFRFSTGLRALCVVLIRDLLSGADPVTIGKLPSLHKQFLTVYRLVKQPGANWIDAVFGSDADGESYLPFLVRNRGSESNPAPETHPNAEVTIWREGIKITSNHPMLSTLLCHLIDPSATGEDDSTDNAGFTMRTGYYDSAFITQVCSEAVTSLSFLAHRNIALTDIFVLDSLRQAAGRDVRIRLLALSSQAPSYVLREALPGMPRPIPRDANEFSRQLAEGEAKIYEFMSQVDGDVQYRGYGRVPIQHFVVCDDTAHIGFCAFDRPAQPAFFNERSCLTGPMGSPLGRQIQQQFDIMWSNAVGIDELVQDHGGIKQSA